MTAPGQLPDPDALRADDLAALAALDRAGRPAGPGETLEAYRARLKQRLDAVAELDRELAERGEVELFGEVTVAEKDRIPDEIIAEAMTVTDRLYGFAIERFPGFFLSRDVGLLWGGCLISDTDHPLAIFLIRGSFRNKERFFIYNRRELLAHELCHSFRQELHDVELEEFFAYQTSPSRLRRYLGNCFIRQRDAFYFMVPALLLLLAQLVQSFWLERMPVWPFWLPALGVPAWLLVRNELSRRSCFRAWRKLASFGVERPAAVLFRLTAAEREAIGRLGSKAEFESYLAGKDEIRWRVIIYRFIEKRRDHETCGSDTGA